jgi:hypothetical protein
MRIAAIIALASASFLCLMLCFVALEARPAVAQAGDVVASADRLIHESQRRIAQTSANANAVLIQLGLAASEWRRASERQQEYAAGVLAILKRTETTLSAVEEAARGANAATESTAVSLQVAIKGIELSVAGVALEAQAAVKVASQQAGNPDIGASLAAARQAAEQAATTAANLAHATESVKLALEPLRKTSGRLKKLATWVIDRFRVNIP